MTIEVVNSVPAQKRQELITDNYGEKLLIRDDQGTISLVLYQKSFDNSGDKVAVIILNPIEAKKVAEFIKVGR